MAAPLPLQMTSVTTATAPPSAPPVPGGDGDGDGDDDDDVDWDALVRAHRQRVLLSVLALGVPFDAAEDIVGETWLRLLARRRAGELPRLELPGLAIVQARFLALDALCRQSRSAAAAAREIERAEARRPLDALVERERLARVASVLASSSPKARAIFTLAFDDPPLPHAQIAERVGLSVQRVRQTLWELRRRLRAELGEDEAPR